MGALLAMAEMASDVRTEHQRDLLVVAAEVEDHLTQWFAGAQLTDNAEENERRAWAARDALRLGIRHLTRLAADALLLLPRDHPLRDLDAIRASLIDLLADRERAGDLEMQWAIVQDLLGKELVSEQEGASLAAELRKDALASEGPNPPLDSQARRNALKSALGWHLRWIARAKEQGLGMPAEHTAAAMTLVRDIQPLRETVRDDLALAWAFQTIGRDDEAIAILQRLVDARSEVSREAARIEVVIRLNRREAKRSIELLELLVPEEEQGYLLALDPDEAASTGEEFSEDAVALAFVYAGEARWSDALRSLERAKSSRLRHIAKLRQTEAGRELMRIEAELGAVRRGVPREAKSMANRTLDPIGSRLSELARLLEQYRSARPELATSTLAPPSLCEVASRLEDAEAVVCLGMGKLGFMAIAITARDQDAPSATCLVPELSHVEISDLFTDGDDLITGWILELVARAPMNPEPALARMLERVDGAIGSRLRDCLREAGARKVTIIPHGLLHAVPFWALPHLSDYDVRTAPSLADWLDARGAVPAIAGKALVVGDPTRDLVLAKVEAQLVGRVLGGRGCDVALLTGEAAEEDAVRSRVKGAGILHFAGHGRSKLAQPYLSALLMHPPPHWGWPAVGDPLGRRAAEVKRWTDLPNWERYADVPDGRLFEACDDDGTVAERRLEYGPSGTLWSRYHEGACVQVAELWSVADMLIDDAVRGCGMAFLAACETARAGQLMKMDEATGLPGALRVAGVGTVVCTLWPVSNLAALVFSSLFYARMAQTEGEFDVARAVQDCRKALSTMDRAAAADALKAIRIATPDLDRASRAELAFTIDEVASGKERPFEHPLDWAAFCFLGSERVKVSWPRADSDRGAAGDAG